MPMSHLDTHGYQYVGLLICELFKAVFDDMAIRFSSMLHKGVLRTQLDAESALSEAARW